MGYTLRRVDGGEKQEGKKSDVAKFNEGIKKSLIDDMKKKKHI